jgi:GNAT superfamily N-acetyltransferase
VTYTFQLADGEADYPELEPLYRQHYAEMRERLAAEGIDYAPYSPRLDAYFNAVRAGYLLHFTARTEAGQAVGYANIYLTNDMHNGELIAREDTIFILKDHRNGIGRKLMRFILDDLKGRGCKRALGLSVTDPRVETLWRRMGFRKAGTMMIYSF